MPEVLIIYQRATIIEGTAYVNLFGMILNLLVSSKTASACFVIVTCSLRGKMNFGLPPVKGSFEEQKELGIVTGSFGVHDSFGFGIKKVKETVEVNHPLEHSEKNYALKEEKLNLAMLRNNQGLHAPIKIMAELRAARQVGRLPFLESSNLSADTIKNNDEFIDFTDFLNHPDSEERMFIPHVMVERKLGLL